MTQQDMVNQQLLAVAYGLQNQLVQSQSEKAALQLDYDDLAKLATQFAMVCHNIDNAAAMQPPLTLAIPGTCGRIYYVQYCAL